jgi:D-cysteine desulfhydrase
LTALLHERFPELRATLPHVRLGEPPSPVRELRALAGDPGPEVWLKDDGAYGAPHGGNKVRKLEWILPDAEARGCRTIVTVGALATNHGLATAVWGRRRGLQTALALVDQPLDDHVEAQFERIRRSGARIYRTRGTYRTYLAAPWIMVRHASLRTRRLPYFLTVGGSSPLGALGYTEAALELAAQVRAGDVPEPSHIVVALGSGGTAAGLAAGVRIAGLRSRVVGVVVNDRTPVDARTVARLATRALELLRKRGADVGAESISPADLDSETEWLGEGYGHRTPEAERVREAAARLEGLALDPVYTAKAVAGLLALRERGAFGGGPVLYWHTYGSPAPTATEEYRGLRPPKVE